MAVAVVAGAGVPAPMHRLAEGLVREREQQAHDQQHQGRDPAEPAERDQRGEDAACAVLLAEEEVAPDVLSSAAVSNEEEAGWEG